jgi:hypothetical protein
MSCWRNGKKNYNFPSLDGRGMGRVKAKITPSPQSPPTRGGEVALVIIFEECSSCLK